MGSQRYLGRSVITLTQFIVLSTILILLVLLVKSRLRPELLFPGVVVIYYFLGYLDTKTLFMNYTNPSLMTLILLLLVSIVIEKTTLISAIAALIFKRSYHRSLMKLTLVTSLFSAFLNNTAVVSSFLGMIKNNGRHAPSKLLIPLSYAAIFGGTMTLIGTSTNLIINGFVIEQGMEPLKIFDFLYVGLPLTLAGIITIMLFAKKLLPEHAIEKEPYKRFFLETRVTPDSRLIGKSIQANGFRNLENLFLAEIIRDGKLISPVTPDEIVQPGDELIFTGDIEQVQRLKEFDGLDFFENTNDILSSNLVEVVISHESTLLGKSIKGANFRTRFDAAVVAVRRGEEKLSGKIGLIQLDVGDRLVLAVGNDFRKRDNLNKNFYFISDIRTEKKLTHKESLLVGGSFVAVIALSVFQIVPFIKGLMFLLLLFLAMRFTTLSQIKRRMPFDLILIIGSALGISHVLIATGSAALLSSGIQALFGSYGTYGAFIGVYLLTLLLTELITNNAAAALAFPIAYATATGLDVNALPFVMAVAYGASASFMTPYGYQTNLMVYSVGEYTFKNYLKMGLPVSIVYSAVVLLSVPYFFPF